MTFSAPVNWVARGDSSLANLFDQSCGDVLTFKVKQMFC